MNVAVSAVRKLSAAHLGIQEEWDDYELNQMDGMDSRDSQVWTDHHYFNLVVRRKTQLCHGPKL